MNQTDQLYKKITELATGVKKDLKLKGIIIPVKDKAGNIKFGSFTIVRRDDGFSIIDDSNYALYTRISLPQAAILTANKLALGQRLDPEVLQNDQCYANNKFEEQQFNRIAESAAKATEWERYDTCTLRRGLAQEKAAAAKKVILAMFDKLCAYDK